MNMRTIAAALFAAAALALMFAWLTIPQDTAAQTGDYDTDNDGLIEIRALEQLNAVRWDLDGDGDADSQTNQDAYAAAFPNTEPRMGCPDSGCGGYELARDLDFDDPGSYASGAVNTKWTTGAGWLPIGLTDSSFRASFDGNDHTIANLYINRSGRTDPGVVGLFGSTSGYISRIGLTGVDISGVEHVGGLVGWNSGQISASYATGSVSGTGSVGGLVGNNGGPISASYATGNVSGDHYVGGLAGQNTDDSAIYASYATGDVAGNSYVGGLLGGNSGVIDAGYWDTQTTGQSSGVGEGSSDGAAGKTTAELQAPTGYTGIYAAWLIDVDNADSDFDDTTGVDDFWDFGTSAQYPALKADFDFDGDGIATWQEFGGQRGQSPSPAPTPVATPEPTPAPTPAPQADLELTMLLSDYLGFLWYYMIVENNGPANAAGIVLTDSFPEGISPMLSIPVQGTCSGEKPVMCELGDLAVGSKTLVMIIARLDDPLSQNVPANTASVTAAESDPYPANNEASR